jgi:hypothetical protein
MDNSWRAIARPVIAAVIDRVGRGDDVALKRALYDAYPFGERKMWPYKVWLDEIKAQLNGEALREPVGPQLF